VNFLQYAFSFLLLSIITVVLYKRFQPVNPWLFWSAWLMRFVCAIALGLVYKNYYTVGDTWNFFSDAVQLSQLAKTDFVSYIRFLWSEDLHPEIFNQLISSDRSVLLVKFASVFALLSNDNYWIACLYFSMISFASAWFLFFTIRQLFPALSSAAAGAILFFPSVVFWSSGLIKETIALAALYLITATLVRYLVSQNLNFWETLFSLIAFYFLWQLKYYWAALYAAVVITTIATFFIKNKSAMKPISLHGSWLLIFVFILALVTLTHPNFYIHRLLEVVFENNQQFVNLSKHGNCIEYIGLNETWWSFCLNTPIALFSGLFRPFVWEAHGLMGWFAAMENLFLLILFVWWIMTRRKLPGEVLLPIFTYSILLTVFLALSSPNFGTLSRYRIGFLPFFVFALSAYHPAINYLFRSGPDLPK
jgi:hypothetical protein